MAVPAAVNDIHTEIKARIAARNAEIAQLEKALAELKRLKAIEEDKLGELEMAFRELRAAI